MRYFILFLFVAGFSAWTKADQLAYISRDQADRAVKEMSAMKTLYLYCGCCDNDEPTMIRPLKVYAQYTGYESYYEVIVEFRDKDGQVKQWPVDLAYTWFKKKKKYQTVGELLHLEHDPCNTLGKYYAGQRS